jgi:hypothetical protein
VYRQARSKARQLQYEAKFVAISTYHHVVLQMKMTKKDAKRLGVTMDRDEYLAVSITDFSFHSLW